MNGQSRRGKQEGWMDADADEGREMASTISLADTDWSEHMMRDGACSRCHSPGSPYNTGEGIETAVWRRYKGRGVGQLGDDVV
jgi:hypothetical protein